MVKLPLTKYSVVLCGRLCYMLTFLLINVQHPDWLSVVEVKLVVARL